MGYALPLLQYHNWTIILKWYSSIIVKRKIHLLNFKNWIAQVELGLAVAFFLLWLINYSANLLKVLSLILNQFNKLKTRLFELNKNDQIRQDVGSSAKCHGFVNRKDLLGIDVQLPQSLAQDITLEALCCIQLIVVVKYLFLGSTL